MCKSLQNSETSSLLSQSSLCRIYPLWSHDYLIDILKKDWLTEKDDSTLKIKKLVDKIPVSKK